MPADQVSVEPAPSFTLLGVAFMTIVGAGEVTESVVDFARRPPGPLHVSVYVASRVRGPVACDPLGGLLPAHAPDAVHNVALADCQFNVALAPLLIEPGATLKATVGAAAATEIVADCDALPPAPLHVSV